MLRIHTALIVFVTAFLCGVIGVNFGSLGEIPDPPLGRLVNTTTQASVGTDPIPTSGGIYSVGGISNLAVEHMVDPATCQSIWMDLELGTETVTTIPALGACGAGNNGQRKVVTDATTMSDATVGGGTARHSVKCVNPAWVTETRFEENPAFCSFGDTTSNCAADPRIGSGYSGSATARSRCFSGTAQTGAASPIYASTFTLDPGASWAISSVTASPASGVAPVTNVDVTVTAAGSATGNITNDLDCDATDGLWWVTGGNQNVAASCNAAIASGESACSNVGTANPFTFTDQCNYASAASYVATVRSTRQSVVSTTPIGFNATATGGAGSITSIFSGTSPCPAPGTTASASSITHTMIDPMPGTSGAQECGNNGPSTITINFDHAYTYSCYADGYSIWILDDGDGVNVTSVSTGASPNSYAIDPVPDGSTSGKPWTDTSFSGNIDPGATPKSLTVIDRPGYAAMNMPTTCNDNSYGDYRYGYTFTMVNSAPSSNGSTVIRPPWNLTTKDSLNTTDLDLTNFFPTFNASDANMPSLYSPIEAMRRCIVESYIYTPVQTTQNYPAMNYLDYHTENRRKFYECTTQLAFSAGPNSLTLDQRKQALYGLVTQALALRNLMEHGVNEVFISNSGFGAHGAFHELAFLAGAWPAYATEFKARFTTRMGNTTRQPGLELNEDGYVWLHGNGNYYIGNARPNVTCCYQSACYLGGPVPPGDSQYGTSSDTCRDRDGNADDINSRGGYNAMNGGNLIGQLGPFLAFPKVFSAVAATGNAGLKFFHIGERLLDFGTVGNGGGQQVPPNDLKGGGGRNSGVRSVVFYEAIKGCSRTTTGTGVATKFNTYTAACSGHTVIP